MFYHDKRLQFRVRVERPNPVFARALQQAIGGVEGEIRVCLQYLFQAWGARGPTKYRDMLLETGTEEISHIEMLSTAVALNLEQAPLSFQEEAAQNPVAWRRAERHGPAPHPLVRAGRDADRRQRGAVRLLAHLRERQSGGRHVRQHRRPRRPAGRSRSGSTA